jgi:hypothetical protein
MGEIPDSASNVVSDRPGVLGRELIANQHVNYNLSVAGFLAAMRAAGCNCLPSTKARPASMIGAIQ